MGNSSSTPGDNSIAAEKPKCPMCVCKKERAVRDECMLQHEDGLTSCKEKIEKLNLCLKGYGFNMKPAESR